MSGDERSLWLATAWAEVKDYSAGSLRQACQTARRTCDHPAKLVPAIVRECEDIGDYWISQLRTAEARAANAGVAVITRAAPLRAIEDNSPVDMDQAEIAALPKPLRDMALSQGWLTQEMIAAADAACRKEQSDAA